MSDNMRISSNVQELDANRLVTLSPNHLNIVYRVNSKVSAVVNQLKPEKNEMILQQHWPMQIISIQWHPTKDEWLIVARELKSEDGKTRIYRLTEDGTPQAITGEGYYVNAFYTPDGEDILAAVSNNNFLIFNDETQKLPYAVVDDRYHKLPAGTKFELQLIN